MEKYHNIVCPYCHHEFMPQNGKSHLECPSCHNTFSLHEIKFRRPITIWDIIRKIFN